MTKNKKLNLDNTTKKTLSLTAIFAPLLLNSNTANASISSRLSGPIVRSASIARSYSNYMRRYAGDVTVKSGGPLDDLKARFSRRMSDFGFSLSQFANSRIITRKPAVSRGPVLDFFNTRIIRQPAQREGQTTGGQSVSRQASSVSTTSSLSIPSQNSSGGPGRGGNKISLSKMFGNLKRNKKQDGTQPSDGTTTVGTTTDVKKFTSPTTRPVSTSSDIWKNWDDPNNQNQTTPSRRSSSSGAAGRVNATTSSAQTQTDDASSGKVNVNNVATQTDDTGSASDSRGKVHMTTTSTQTDDTGSASDGRGKVRMTTTSTQTDDTGDNQDIRVQRLEKILKDYDGELKKTKELLDDEQVKSEILMNMNTSYKEQLDKSRKNMIGAVGKIKNLTAENKELKEKVTQLKDALGKTDDGLKLSDISQGNLLAHNKILEEHVIKLSDAILKANNKIVGLTARKDELLSSNRELQMKVRQLEASLAQANKK